MYSRSSFEEWELPVRLTGKFVSCVRRDGLFVFGDESDANLDSFAKRFSWCWHSLPAPLRDKLLAYRNGFQVRPRPLIGLTSQLEDTIHWEEPPLVGLVSMGCDAFHFQFHPATLQMPNDAFPVLLAQVMARACHVAFAATSSNAASSQTCSSDLLVWLWGLDPNPLISWCRDPVPVSRGALSPGS
jgi:hypothetical protein